MRTLAVSLAVAAGVLSACSDGNDVPQLEAATPTTQASTATTPSASSASVTSTPALTTAAVLAASASSTTAASPPNGAGSVEHLLGERVRAFFEVRHAANGLPAPDPDDRRLVAVATGSALVAVRGEAAGRLEKGEAVRPASPSKAAVRVGFVTIEGAAATVSACRVDDGVVFERATGRVLNDAVATHNYAVDLVLEAGVWKVSEVTRIQEWEGVAGCALADADFPY